MAWNAELASNPDVALYGSKPLSPALEPTQHPLKPQTDRLEICGKHGFYLSSPQGVPTSYSAKGNGTAIDLVWENLLAFKIVQCCKIFGENQGSDHQAAVITLSLKKPPQPINERRESWFSNQMC